MNIAFAGVGRRVELLEAFRAAQETLGLEGRLIGLDSDPLAPALRVADSRHIVPRMENPAFIPELVRICADEEVDLLFPLIDPLIEFLADHRSVIEETGARFAGVSPRSARIAGDKLLLSKFFSDLNLNSPRTWLPAQVPIDGLTFPLFIKPRKGSASQNAFKICNSEEMRFFESYIEDPIVQEFLPGPEITSDVVCDLEGEVLAVVSRRRIEVRSGEVSKGVTMADPRITEACVRIAEALPAIGPITVQCMMKDDEPYFTEINARLGGGIPLAIAAGSNLLTFFLSRAAKVPMTIPPLGSYEVGIHMTRFDDSFFMKLDEVDGRGSAHMALYVDYNTRS